MYSFFSEVDFFLTEADEKLIVPVLNKILEDYGFKEDYINIVFMNDEQLLSINKEFLNHDYYTDIITFPYHEQGKPIEAELYISIERITENALINNVTTIQELFRVLIHGVLHLVGLDDSSQALKNNMQHVENQYIKQICFT